MTTIIIPTTMMTPAKEAMPTAINIIPVKKSITEPHDKTIVDAEVTLVVNVFVIRLQVQFVPSAYARPFIVTVLGFDGIVRLVLVPVLLEYTSSFDSITFKNVMFPAVLLTVR